MKFEVLEALGIAAEERLSVLLTLDKLEKAGKQGVIQELMDKGLNSQLIEAITELIELDNPSLDQIAGKYGIEQSLGSSEVRTLELIIRQIGLEAVCQFDPFLSRGLSFYTGTVYEIVDATLSFSSSLGGGGRYDAIIGKLVGREDIIYPAVGLSFGMESIMELLNNRSIEWPRACAAVIPIGETIAEVLKAAAELRAEGIRTTIDTTRRKLKKSLAAASSSGIRYVLLIGEDEAADGKVRLKDMEEKTEMIGTMEEILYLLRNQCTGVS